jgi:hypothetical protein
MFKETVFETVVRKEGRSTARSWTWRVSPSNVAFFLKKETAIMRKGGVL